MRKTTEWTPSQSLADSSIKQSTLRSGNIIVRITYREDTPAYRIKIFLEPKKDTPNTCPFAIFNGSYDTGDLEAAQRKSLGILLQYMDTIRTEIKEHLKNTICLRI